MITFSHILNGPHYNNKHFVLFYHYVVIIPTSEYLKVKIFNNFFCHYFFFSLILLLHFVHFTTLLIDPYILRICITCTIIYTHLHTKEHFVWHHTPHTTLNTFEHFIHDCETCLSHCVHIALHFSICTITLS